MQPGLTFDSIRNRDPLALNIISKGRYFYYAIKRVMDLFISLSVLIILSPLLLIVSILIKLDSPGPVFFKQDRVGIKRKSVNHVNYWQRVTFTCYKFRTMISDADYSIHRSYIKALIDNDTDGIVALQGEESKTRKLTHDSRITKIGKFLRKSSIDEIPQFINVIKGEMSIVGPRPAIPYEVEMYKPWYFRRLETKPGITGLWQVTARSSCDYDEIIKLDIEYVEHQSFWLDLKIILKTPIAVLLCRGAV
jgi:lipopolysaccharide/colanic/teichoic acid biosynthesis glycosyltransferase